MIIDHPSEEQLQAYALESDNSDTTLSLHINTCENCKAAVATYRFIANVMRQCTKPAFEFDLAVTVLAQLQNSKTVTYRRLDVLLSAMAVIFVAILMYIYRKQVADLFAGTSILFMFTALVSAAILVILRLDENYKIYRRQMLAQT
jgi:hypothetical protein